MNWEASILKEALDAFPEKWADARAELASLYKLRSGTDKEREDARKRLEHPGFKATSVATRLQGLDATQHRIRIELEKSLPQTISLLLQDAFVELLAADLQRARDRNEARTRQWHQTKLYEGAREAFEHWYINQQVTADKLRDLRPHELDEVGELINDLLSRPGSVANPISLWKSTDI